MAKKHLGIAMALFLLMTPLPFAVSAQSGGVTKNTNTKSAPESKEVTLTLEGIFCGFGMFIFEGQTIRYEHSKDYYPTKVRIDGVPWDDLSKPFQLDFTPDFAKAAIVEKQARSIVELFPGSNSISLRINDYDIPAAYYMIKIAIKNQIKRPLPPPVNRSATRREPTMREIMDMEEKMAKQPGGWRPPIEGSTDGMNHPRYPVTRSVSPPVFGLYRAEVKGTVDKKAEFRFDGTTILYLDNATNAEKPSDSTPVLFDDAITSKITVNGKEWSNLSKAFEIKNVDATEATSARFKPGDYEAQLYLSGKKMDVIITNKADKPVPFVFLVWNTDAPSDITKLDKNGKDGEEEFRDSTDSTRYLHSEYTIGQNPISALATWHNPASSNLIAERIPSAVNGPMVVSLTNESTIGIDQPHYALSSPVSIPESKSEHKIVIKGTIDQNSGFRIQGNHLYYLNYQSGPSGRSGYNVMMYEGKFASGVTVNGKPWSNLTEPFELDVSQNTPVAKSFSFKSNKCDYCYDFHHDLLEINITNKNLAPVPFELTMVLSN